MRPAPPSDPDQSAALELLIAIARAFKAIDDRVRPRMAAQGLAMTEFAVLEVLYHQGPIPLGDLSQRILVTGASTTYTVKKLEARKLLRRKTGEQDQRVVFAELTATGRHLIEKVFPQHARDLRDAMSGLSTADKRAASRLLRRLQSGAAEPKII